jgi:DNA modification methylase
MAATNNGVSLLDPVLAEIANKWFGLDNCNTFDCFAGDSVFGYISDALGNTFTGIELRQEQTDLNNQRLKGSKSKYICDDGQNVLKHIKEDSQDLLFSCPPYFDLEVYSDLKNDASNQKEYKDFLQILDNAFTRALTCLKENRFAVIVVGDIRDKKGFYYGFADDVKNIFIKNGAKLYNEMIIAESIGTLPQRVGRYMHNRKVGKCHQNVLVFYKGNPKEIKNIYKKLDFKNIVVDESADI